MPSDVCVAESAGDVNDVGGAHVGLDGMGIKVFCCSALI